MYSRASVKDCSVGGQDLNAAMCQREHRKDEPPNLMGDYVEKCQLNCLLYFNCGKVYSLACAKGHIGGRSKQVHTFLLVKFFLFFFLYLEGSRHPWRGVSVLRHPSLH